jgi:hypothetical protein
VADKTKDQSRRKWRALGFHVENAEFFISIGRGRGIKRDLFGFADLVALPRGRKPHPLVFIQATSWGHVSTRLRKIQTETTGKGQWEVPLRELAHGVLLAGQRIVVEGWKKDGRTWIERVHWITEEDLNDYS